MQDIFPQLPDNARVWVYQSNRPFTETESEKIAGAIDAFVRDWASHSRQVSAGGALLYNRFIVLIADETAFTVSGCSIDSSVHFVKQLAQQHGVDLFDRMNVAWKEGDEVHGANRAGFEQAIEQSRVTEDTIVFNNLVQNKQQLLNNWQIPLKDSWHARVFVG